MMQMTAGELMQSLQILKDKIVWVKCPFCDDEVSKLRPCLYWQDGTLKKSYVCVECAECVKGLTYLAAHYPIPGVDVSLELMPLYLPPMDEKYISEKSYKAKVSYGEWIFEVYPKGPKLGILENRKTPDQEKIYDNTYQVWFALKKIYEKGQGEEKTKNMWGNNV